MSTSDKKLEAISLMRFMPAGAADIGEDVTRQDLRDAGLGTWSAPCGRVDDLRGLGDYDQPLPADAAETDADAAEDVLELRLETA